VAEPAVSQPQAYTADGQPIAPEDYAAAAAKGAAFFEKGQRVFVHDAAGNLKSVDAAEVGTPGLRLLSPAEVEQISQHREFGKGLGNMGKAAAAGAARGLTLGASDAALTALGGDDTRRALKGLREQNPITSTVSEVAGAAAPVLLSGGSAAPEEAAALGGEAAAGAGLVSRGIQAAGVLPRAVAGAGGIVERGVARGLESLGYEGSSLASRVAAGALKMGASGAAEGAIYGGAQAANDAVLNGDEITAEKIVSGMGHGALFGGGVGATLGAAGPLVTGAASALIPKKETLEQLSREQAGRAAGFKPSDYKALVGRARGAAAEERIATTLDDLRNYEIKTGELAGQKVLQPASNAEEILERVRAAKSEAGATLDGLKDSISEGMQQSGYQLDRAALAQRIEDNVFKPALEGATPSIRRRVLSARKELGALFEPPAEGVAGDVSPTFRELDQMRAKLREVFQPPAVRGGGLPPPAPKQAIYLEGAEREIASYLKDEAGKFLATAGEDANAYNEANRLYHSFRQLDDVGTKATAHNLGNRMASPSDHAVGLGGFLGALTTGNVGAAGAMAYGAAGAIANKLMRERGNSLIATLAQRAADQDASIDRVAQILGGESRVKAPALAAALQGENLRDSYQRAAERVRELSTPQVAQSHISSLIPEVAARYPQLGMTVSNKLLQIYSELKAKLPQNHVETGTTLTPLAIKERIPPAQMRDFLSSVKGALTPEKVLAELGRGVVDRPALEMLKAMHPQTFQQLRQRVAEVVEQRQDELPTRRRVMLSMVFDFVGDSSVEPQRLTGLQKTAVDLTNQETLQDAAAVKPKQGNPGKSKLGKALTLPSQAAFAGET
jgi:hypothetical protein